MGLATLAARRTATGPKAPSRVVVVVIDTLRRDHLPFYGYPRPTAPFLTRLAGESVVFEHAYSTSSWTAPATASLFTSLYPFQHGVTLGLRATRKLMIRDARVRLNRIPEAAQTLPEALRPAGYATFAITENVNVSRALGFAQGFDSFANLPSEDTAAALNAKLLAWRGRLTAAPRSFLYLHYLDPHSPYTERAPWFDAGASGRERTLSAYDSEISYVDEHLRQAYEAFGWGHDTLLVVTADHGEEFWDHGSVDHGRSLYGEVVNIPLLVRLPGGTTGGRRVAAPVSLIDVLPTLRACVGLPASAADEGIDLLPLIAGQRGPERTLFVHLWRPEPESGRVLDLMAGIAEGRKVITGDGPEPMIFDVLQDPLDQQGLFEAPLAARLRERIARFERSARRLQADLAEIPMDADTQDRLRSLGYVE